MAKRMKPADVVVIGLGAAGGTAVKPLAEAGATIVGLEAGTRFQTSDYPLDEIRNDIRNWPGEAKVNREVPTWREKAGEEAGVAALAPGGQILMNNGVGGSSIHWTGQAWRYLPWNFATRSETIKRYGHGYVPRDSTVADWPVGYDDLKPYYDKTEYLHGISGLAGNIAGKKNPKGNIFEAPRQREYPTPPMVKAGWGAMIEPTMKQTGYHPFIGPSGARSEPYNGMGGCSYCGFCTYTGCFLDAKAGSQLAGIPEAEKSGNLTVVTGARATSIDVDGDGRATGVTYVKGGTEYFQPAKVVVMAGYVYENTRLLLLSKSKAFPTGLSNKADQVGKNYMSHFYCSASGVFPGMALNTFNGTGAQGVCIDDLDADNFDHQGLGFIGGGIITAGQETKPIERSRTVPPGLPSWGPKWKQWMHDNGNSIGGILAQLECLPYEDSFLDLDPVKKDPYGVPVVRVTFRVHEQEEKRWNYVYGKMENLLKAAGAKEVLGSPVALPTPVNSHAYGGTRMGAGPDDSVVDKWHMSHEVPNLMILGGSVYPTTTGYNPTLTIMSMAWRAGDHLANELKHA